MATSSVAFAMESSLTPSRLVALLNDDLSREYYSLMSCVVYSQLLKGAEFMAMARELEQRAHEELQHAFIISKQIDYFGGKPTVTPKHVTVSLDPREMLRLGLEHVTVSIRNYRERLQQCEAVGQFALAEQIRRILVQEQNHQMALATALGEDILFDDFDNVGYSW